MALYYYVLVVAVVAAFVNDCSAITDEQKEVIRQKLRANALACASELGFTNDQLTQWKQEKREPDDSNKCFVACMFKKSGLIDDQGLYSEAVALEKINPYLSDAKKDEVNGAIKACSSVNAESVGDGNAGCDRAVLLFKCFKQQKDLLGLSLYFSE
ncbi:general odorant-binding protein 69a-like [Leguminivora glycinivorella]|uniref:general odorant-binding protein 69a-like n=1 Tax=Leguminivora glycinivorella TaxID=1035111 RepID=UPI00200E74ED|nr:general odorant-binding protein 69a-like [Leguminivora glycinivorella]